MKRRFLWAMVAIVQLAAALVVEAQIEVRARCEGEWLPVVKCGYAELAVQKDGRRTTIRRGDVRVDPIATFGEGAVNIANVQIDLDPLRNASAKDRSKPDSIAFRYAAEVTSAGDLSDCYALLVFVANGSVGTQLLPIGRLRAGHPEKLKLELTSRVDAVGHLHVFSGSAEIRSNQVPQAYDAREYWESLARSSVGVSAAALCKSEERVPLALSRDGKLLATSQDQGDHYAILVYDLPSMKVVSEVAVGQEKKRSYNFGWAWNWKIEVRDLTWTSARDLAFVSGWGDLMLVNIDRKTCKTLREDVGHILKAQRDRPEVIVIRCYKGWDDWTSLYDVREEKTVDWDSLNEGYTSFDAHGKARFASRSTSCTASSTTSCTRPRRATCSRHCRGTTRTSNR